MQLTSQITILIPTHFMASAPSTELIELTIRSLEQFDVLHNCRCIIGYDLPIQQWPQHLEYLKNLRSIRSKFQLEVSPVIGAQIRKNFLNLIEQVRTRYFLLVEHDWEFIHPPNLPLLVEVMNKYKRVNCVYFNKRGNRFTPHYMMREESDISEIPLMRTTRWSNNPSLTRTSHYRNEWIPKLERRPADRSKPGKQIEHILQEAYFRDVERDGFDSAHLKWGTYEYGGWRQMAMVRHLDGKHFSST